MSAGSTWYGKPLADMSREELIEALEQMGRTADSAREASGRERQFFVDLLKGWQPRRREHSIG